MGSFPRVRSHFSTSLVGITRVMSALGQKRTSPSAVVTTTTDLMRTGRSFAALTTIAYPFEAKKLSSFANLGQKPPICAVGHMWRQPNGLMCLKNERQFMRHSMYGADHQTPLAYRS